MADPESDIVCICFVFDLRAHDVGQAGLEPCPLAYNSHGLGLQGPCLASVHSFIHSFILVSADDDPSLSILQFVICVVTARSLPALIVTPGSSHPYTSLSVPLPLPREAHIIIHYFQNSCADLMCFPECTLVRHANALII